VGQACAGSGASRQCQSVGRRHRVCSAATHADEAAPHDGDPANGEGQAAQVEGALQAATQAGNHMW
jgi:hypothetical protein